MHKDLVRWSELLMRCESAKRQLSVRADAPVTMRDAYPRGDLNVLLDRTWVEQCWEPILARAAATIHALLAQAGWTADEVDQVALIGGGAQIPALQRIIRETFAGKPVIIPSRADVSVALGAVLLTARFSTTQRIVPVLSKVAGG